MIFDIVNVFDGLFFLFDEAPFVIKGRLTLLILNLVRSLIIHILVDSFGLSSDFFSILRLLVQERADNLIDILVSFDNLIWAQINIGVIAYRLLESRLGILG